MVIRPTVSSDMAPLLNMLQVSGQFDKDALEHIQETLNTHFSNESNDLWYSVEQKDFAGIAYCSPDVMANGVWNLLMLWVSPLYQRQGIGMALVERIEKDLKNNQGRLLIIETSSLDEFTAARAFYRKQGFIEEARLRNYYAYGEDKLIYTKTIEK